MSSRSEQLRALERELAQARERLHAAAQRFDDAAWLTRPAPNRWSAAECVAHLNMTSEAFLPVIRKGLAEAMNAATRSTRAWRAGFLGGLFCKLLEPPVRLRAKTTPPFIPQGNQPRTSLLREFDRLQAEIEGLLRGSAKIDLSKIRVQSVFNANVHYNLYACFKIIATHQRRHIWQMEQVHEALTAAAQRGG